MLEIADSFSDILCDKAGMTCGDLLPLLVTLDTHITQISVHAPSGTFAQPPLLGRASLVD